MLKKELKDITKQIIMILSLLVFVPLFYLIDKILWQSNTNYFNIMVIFFGILIYVLANRFGIEMFRSEEDDNAFEYLLTLPISKTRIFFNKILLRIGFLIPMFLIYNILIGIADEIKIGSTILSKLFPFDPIFFPVFVVLLLLYFSFISIFGRKNFTYLIATASLVVTGLLGGTIREMIYDSSQNSFVGDRRDGVSFLIALVIVTVIFAITFYFILKRFDSRGQRYFGEKFALRLLIPMVIITVFSFIFLVILRDKNTKYENLTQKENSKNYVHKVV